MSTRTDPIGTECRHRDTCTSCLLVGGIQYISPWPYMWLSDDAMTSFLTKDMPVYVLEGWNMTTDISISWGKNECRVYQAGSTALQVCAKKSDKGGSILTGKSVYARLLDRITANGPQAFAPVI